MGLGKGALVFTTLSLLGSPGLAADSGPLEKQFRCFNSIFDHTWWNQETTLHVKDNRLVPLGLIRIRDESEPGSWFFLTEKGAFKQKFEVPNKFQVDPKSDQADDPHEYGPVSAYVLNLEGKPPAHMTYGWSRPKPPPKSPDIDEPVSDRKDEWRDYLHVWTTPAPRPGTSLQSIKPQYLPSEKAKQLATAALIQQVRNVGRRWREHESTLGFGRGSASFLAALDACDGIPEIATAVAEARRAIDPKKAHGTGKGKS